MPIDFYTSRQLLDAQELENSINREIELYNVANVYLSNTAEAQKSQRNQEPLENSNCSQSWITTAQQRDKPAKEGKSSHDNLCRKPAMKASTEYQRIQSPPADELVRQHALLVRRIAYHLKGRLPASVEVDDLIQAGMIGLLEAARNYSPSRTAHFETYAGIRIRGAMLDELRKTDWTPRSVHRKAREVIETIRQVESETGKHADETEVARRLGISKTEYDRIVTDATSCRLLSLSTTDTDESAMQDVVDEDGLGPAATIEKDRLQESLATAIAGLPERERLVMSLYYDDELNLKEIGEVLGVTESRACQIHGQALIRMRSRLADW